MKDIYWQIVQRSLGVYSKEEQDRIREGRVTVVGVGCDGGMDAYILTRMGTGHLRLIDRDENELSNINRQPMATYATEGVPKVYAAKMILRDINPTVEVAAIDDRLTEANAEELLQGSDVVLQCTDSMPARIVSVRAAKRLGIPIVVMTGQPPFRSFVSTVMPDGPTYEELFGIDFMAEKSFADDSGLAHQVEALKYERAEHAAERASAAWLQAYREGKAGWGITPERAYLTSVYQCHEALAILAGRAPKAIAPKAYLSDLDGLAEFGRPDAIAAILAPDRGHWDYRSF